MDVRASEGGRMSINRASLNPEAPPLRGKLAFIEERHCWNSEDLQDVMLTERVCSECGRNMEQRFLLLSGIREIMS